MPTEQVTQNLDKKRIDPIEQFRDVEDMAPKELRMLVTQAILAQALGLHEEFRETIEKLQEIYQKTKSDLEEGGKWNQAFLKLYDLFTKTQNSITAHPATFDHFDKGYFGFESEDLPNFIKFIEKKFGGDKIVVPNTAVAQLGIVDRSGSKFGSSGEYLRIPGTDIFFILFSNKTAFALAELSEDSAVKLEEFRKSTK